MTTTASKLAKSPRYRIRLEPRLTEPSRWYPVLVSLGAIVIALILGGIVITFVGGDPIKSYIHIAKASFGDIGVLSDTIVKATPIMLTALACAIAFRMKLWNIGAEGQFVMGAFGASAVVLFPIVSPESARWVFIPVMVIAGL